MNYIKELYVAPTWFAEPKNIIILVVTADVTNFLKFLPVGHPFFLKRHTGLHIYKPGVVQWETFK